MKRALLLLTLTTIGCADPVRAQQVEALGAEEPGVPPGIDHRAGQPCLVCHSEGGPASSKPFVVAGTVYKNQSPTSKGADGISVQFVDSNSNFPRFVPTTGESGNFFIPVTDWPDLAFPIRVGLYKDAQAAPTIVMNTLINREGSCNFCHHDNIDLKDLDDDEKDVVLEDMRKSVGQIYLEAGGASTSSADDDKEKEEDK